MCIKLYYPTDYLHQLTDQNNLILKEKNDIKRAIRKNLEDIYIS